MEALIGLFFLIGLWLTFLTMKLRKQTLKNKILEKNSKSYMQEIKNLTNGKETKREAD